MYFMLMLLIAVAGIGLLLFTKAGQAVRTLLTGSIGLLFFFGVVFTALYAFVRVSETDRRQATSYRALVQDRGDPQLLHPTSFILEGAGQTSGSPQVSAVDRSSSASAGYPSDGTLAEPDWVDAPPRHTDGDYQTTAMAGPYATREECEQALDIELRKIAIEYVDGVIGEEGAGARMRISAADIRQHAVGDLWEEKIQASFGPMLQLHALLKFDGKHRGPIEAHYRDLVVQGRLRNTGLWSAMVLAMLGTCFTYFKLDTATRGYYSGRLKTAAAAVILALAGVVIYSVRAAEPSADRTPYFPVLVGAVTSPFDTSATAQAADIALPEVKVARRCGPWRPRWID